MYQAMKKNMGSVGTREIGSASGGSHRLDPSRAQPRPPVPPQPGQDGSPSSLSKRLGNPTLISRTQLTGNDPICRTLPNQPGSCPKTLTELALLGFGHGLPAPGPLGTELNRGKK